MVCKPPSGRRVQIKHAGGSLMLSRYPNSSTFLISMMSAL